MNAYRSRCNRFLTIIITGGCVLASESAHANDGSYTPVYRPRLEIGRATGPIEIDGVLGDPGWQGAAVAGNFAEHNPGDQTRPAVDTEVYVTYDDDNLYVAWMCYDEPSQVRASFCERDNIFSDDYVIICLDTFGDATLAYEIASNPYGIPGDLLFSSSNGEDITYDMIFESAGKIVDNGWVVEMAIPFARMRFPERAQQEWRVDFWRNRPRESRYQYSWAAYDRNENCWPCQWGTVAGLDGVQSGAGLDLLPGVIAHQTGQLDGNGDFTDGIVKSDVSLGIAYDFSSELTAEATINPDFSQIESDAAQIDVNSTFALFYPERRPFFQEGSDLFDTYLNAVYTRSINDPILAGKVTWRKGSNSAAILSARDEHSVIILPFEENSRFIANGRSFSNIVRARHDFGEQSHLGMVATDRRFDGGGSGSLAGVDGRLRFWTSNALQFQILASHTQEVDNPALADSAFNETRFDGGRYTAGLDGERFWGHGAYASLSRDTRSYWLGAEYWGRSPTFRADSGFEPSNNVHMGGAWIGGIIRFDDSRVLENINGSVSVGREWNFDRVQKDEWVNIGNQIKLRAAQTGIHSSLLYSNELFGGVYFNDIWQAHTCVSTQPGQVLHFGGYYNYGHRIARWELAMGREISRGVWFDLRPIDRLLISTSFDNAYSHHLDTGEELFSQSIARTHLSLQMTRELSGRVILQYNDRHDVWNFDPLITYRINSFSIFYIGSTQNYQDLTVADHGVEGWRLTNRQFFLKFQYLIRL